MWPASWRRWKALWRRAAATPQAANRWYFPTPADYRTRLEASGFAVASIELIPRPTALPGEIADWLWTFGESFIKTLPASEQADYVAEVAEALRADLCDAQGAWTADSVRLRFAAAKPH